MQFNWAQFITSMVVILFIMHVFLLGVAYLILLERKIASWAQDRIGPNRVGLGGLIRPVSNILVTVLIFPFQFFGLFKNFDPDAIWQKGAPKKLAEASMLGFGQPLADGVKFIAKEDYNPRTVDKTLFILAPVLAAVPALLGWAVIPWGGVWDSFPLITFPSWMPLIGDASIGGHPVNVAGADISVGVIYILAIGSLSVYGIAVGAWAANNKYTFFGGIRGVAQILSYEIPMGLCLLCVLLLAGSGAANDIIGPQIGHWFGLIPKWYVFQQPMVAIMFFICVLAETNRAPFDLAEAEQELIGGFHTEYSSMKFALYFLGEYIHMATGCAFFSLLFLGGWHLPWLDSIIFGSDPLFSGIIAVIIKIHIFLAKVTVLLAVMMWIRWTVPRLRFDQLMGLAWKAMIPLTLLYLLTTGLFVYFGWQDYMLLGNLGATAIAMVLLPLLPSGPPVNRRVPLKGSRFSPLVTAEN